MFASMSATMAQSDAVGEGDVCALRGSSGDVHVKHSVILLAFGDVRMVVRVGGCTVQHDPT